MVKRSFKETFPDLLQAHGQSPVYGLAIAQSFLAGQEKHTLLGDLACTREEYPLFQGENQALINPKVQNFNPNGPSKTWSDVYIAA